MRIAITGKGGVGKTLVAATLARLYADEGRRVLAIDADPDSNLAEALAFPPELAAAVRPISELRQELEARRAEAEVQFEAGEYQVRLRVDDLPPKYAVEAQGVHLLKMGTIPAGGSGCACAINQALRELLRVLLEGDEEVIILDMEAGVEHLGRGTAALVDAFLIVVEPSRASVATAHAIRRLAADIGVLRTFAVANRVRSEAERAFVERELRDVPLLGVVPFDPELGTADLRSLTAYEVASPVVEAIRSVQQCLADTLATSSGSVSPEGGECTS
jgi:CO dehydrogenase maturation factor